MQDLCQPEGQTDSLNPREQTSLYLAKQQVLCHVSQTSLTVHPTQDNTLCSLPTELINTGCRNRAEAYFSWDKPLWDLLIL